MKLKEFLGSSLLILSLACGCSGARRLTDLQVVSFEDTKSIKIKGKKAGEEEEPEIEPEPIPDKKVKRKFGKKKHQEEPLDDVEIEDPESELEDSKPEAGKEKLNKDKKDKIKKKLETVDKNLKEFEEQLDKIDVDKQ